MSIRQKLTTFIFYHNAVPIALGALFLGAGGALAMTPAGRDMVVSSETVVQGIDNTRLLAVDLDEYFFDVQVLRIEEDDEAYYVHYTLATIELADAVWQDVVKEGTFKVYKQILGRRDLGLYVAEELGGLRARERERLATTQASERQRGESQKTVATVYSGLVGRFLDPRTETFDGYEPVVEGPPPAVIDGEGQTLQAASEPAQKPRPLTAAQIEQIIAARVAALLAGEEDTTDDEDDGDTDADGDGGGSGGGHPAGDGDQDPDNGDATGTSTDPLPGDTDPPPGDPPPDDGETPDVDPAPDPDPDPSLPPAPDPGSPPADPPPGGEAG